MSHCASNSAATGPATTAVLGRRLTTTAMVLLLTTTRMIAPVRGKGHGAYLHHANDIEEDDRLDAKSKPHHTKFKTHYRESKSHYKESKSHYTKFKPLYTKSEFHDFTMEPSSERQRVLQIPFDASSQRAVWRADGDYGCPYATGDEADALARAADDRVPGNVVTIEHLRFCRTGNHFSTVFRNLALGYCCKSKLLKLPPKDDILAPGVFNSGAPGPKWFDFSNAPDVGSFNSSSCKDITWAGERAFKMNHLSESFRDLYNPALLKCIKEVPRMLGCESAYFFPKDADACPPREKARVGNLVMHVRSGDIFDTSVLPYYGQPPLQFYTRAMEDRDWDRIDVLTSYSDERSRNPVIAALQERLADGFYSSDKVHIHTNRTMAEDFRTMMCADALATARSTLTYVTSFHTTATTIYAPVECKKTQELADLRQDVEVYGLDWAGEYSVYLHWENSEDQQREMLAYSNITGFTRCDVTPSTGGVN